MARRDRSRRDADRPPRTVRTSRATQPTADSPSPAPRWWSGAGDCRRDRAGRWPRLPSAADRRDDGRCIIDQGMTHHSLSRYQNRINPGRPLSARRHCPADPSRRRNAATSGSNSKPAAQSRVSPERPARSRICAARTRSTSGESSSRPARNGAVRSLIAPTAAMPIASDARSAQATAGRSLPSVAASATICGEGVSPAASAAASASPPGSAAPTDPRGWRTARGIRFQTAHDHPLDRRIDVGPCARRRRRRRVSRRARAIRRAAWRNAAIAGEHLEQHEAQRVDVAARPSTALPASCSGAMYAGVPGDVVVARSAPRSRQTEVGDLARRRGRPASRSPASSRGAARPCRALPQGRHRAAAPTPRPCLRQPPDAAQQRRQILAVHVLHRQELLAVDLAEVVKRGRRSGARPAARCALRCGIAPAPPGRARRRSRQELQRHRLPERQVVGAIDLAHSPAAEQPDDAVTTGEDGARGSGRAVWRRQRCGRTAAGARDGGHRRRRQPCPARRARVDRVGHRTGADGTTHVRTRYFVTLTRMFAYAVTL